MSAIGAAEGDVRVADVRLGMGVGPMPDKQVGTFTSPSARVGDPVKMSYDSTPGLSVAVGGMYGRLSPFGVLVGAEVRSLTGEMAFESMRLNNGPVQTAAAIEAAEGDKVPGMSYSQSGISLDLGVGWALSRSVHLELVGIVGLDYTTWDSPANFGIGDLSIQEGKGLGYSYGGRLGAYWTDPVSQWQFGLEVELIRTESEIETSYIDTTFETEPVNVGPAIRATLGHRF